MKILNKLFLSGMHPYESGLLVSPLPLYKIFIMDTLQLSEIFPICMHLLNNCVHNPDSDSLDSLLCYMIGSSGLAAFFVLA
jgi:hypothetical protein